MPAAEREVKMSLSDNSKAALFFGVGDVNFRHLKTLLTADLTARGGEILIRGSAEEVDFAEKTIHNLFALVEKDKQLNINDINYVKSQLQKDSSFRTNELLHDAIIATAKGKAIKPRTRGQKEYIQAIDKNEVVFAIGPAGTGKTYLAVAMAIKALRNHEVQRIILVRPAVEAGEKLGFLPGDFMEKVNPYLRPLYDGLFDILGVELTKRYLEKNIIEIAPLAYMRGRTLNGAFIILDEAQNTTPQQMKMFLTRLGFGSQAVITGDVTQVDLPKDEFSGLVEIQKILGNISGVAFEKLRTEDIVRHPLVQKIINAYEEYEAPSE